MAWPDPDSTVWGVKLSTIAAGVGGGIVRALLLRHGWLKSCLGVVVGTVLGVQGTPLVAAIVDRYGFDYLPDPQVDYVAASLLGMTGLTLAEVVLARVKALAKAAPTGAGAK
ncbi:hypothetical protein V5F53_11040 [Xanthobacter sp. V4C-4]|uniref:hypothetical protein n=1 Tax=Xanthobacter cornucopiae TaxID=3119924 RepID=UPI003729064D